MLIDPFVEQTHPPSNSGPGSVWGAGEAASITEVLPAGAHSLAKEAHKPAGGQGHGAARRAGAVEPTVCV